MGINSLGLRAFVLTWTAIVAESSFQSEAHLSPIRRPPERGVQSARTSTLIQPVRRESFAEAEEPVVSEDIPSGIFNFATDDCNGVPEGVNRFAFYHVSKCGGTTLNELLREGALTEAGNGSFIGEFENSCKRIQCNLSPDVFVISSIRNPFSYYVSQFQMLNRVKDIYSYGCVGPALKKLGLFDLLGDPSFDYNRTNFQRFLRFILVDAPRAEPKQEYCHLSLASIYKRLLLPEDEAPRYDYMIPMENYWPSLLRVLRGLECRVPGTFDFNFIEKRVRQAPHGNGFNLLAHKYPYRCFYDDASRRLIETHDRIIFERHGYSFDQFLRSSHGSCEHVVT